MRSMTSDLKNLINLNNKETCELYESPIICPECFKHNVTMTKMITSQLRGSNSDTDFSPVPMLTYWETLPHVYPFYNSNN